MQAYIKLDKPKNKKSLQTKIKTKTKTKTNIFQQFDCFCPSPSLQWTLLYIVAAFLQVLPQIVNIFFMLKIHLFGNKDGCIFNIRILRSLNQSFLESEICNYLM